MSSSPFMTAEECAEYLRVAPTTLYRKYLKEKIPYRKHFGKIIFFKDEVDAWSATKTLHAKVVPLTKFQEAKQRLGI